MLGEIASVAVREARVSRPVARPAPRRTPGWSPRADIECRAHRARPQRATDPRAPPTDRDGSPIDRTHLSRPLPQLAECTRRRTPKGDRGAPAEARRAVRRTSRSSPAASADASLRRADRRQEHQNGDRAATAQLRGGHRRDTRGRELDRQRNPVEAATNPRDRSHIRVVNAKSGSTASRVTNSLHRFGSRQRCRHPHRAGAPPREGKAATRSPSSSSPSRLVASTATFEHQRTISSTSSTTGSSTCSQLSTTRSSASCRSKSTIDSTMFMPCCAWTESAATTATTAAGSGTGANSTSHTPSRNRRNHQPRDLDRQPVLPTPPAPVNVTTRASSAARNAPSRRRPMNALACGRAGFPVPPPPSPRAESMRQAWDFTANTCSPGQVL